MGAGASAIDEGPRVAFLEAEREGESQVIRNILSPDKLIESYFEDVTTLYDNFQRGVKVNPNGNCVGWRNGEQPFQWFSYTTVNEKLHDIGAGFIETGMEPNSRLGIYSPNRVEWIMVEQGCNAYSLTVVPLYDTLGPETCEYIIDQAELSLVCCSKDKTNLLLDCAKNCTNLKKIIQFEATIDPETEENAKKMGVEVLTLDDLISLGQKNPHEVIPPKPDDVATICYTSGTTGDPKGVMLTHKNLIGNAAGLYHTGISFYSTDVHISYLPLAHMFERLVQISLWPFGASVGCFRGDILLLFDDIATLKPTLFPSVPRLYNRLFDKVTAAAPQAGLKKKMFDTAWETKKENLKNGQLTHAVWDSLVFSKISARLGGRVRYMITGSAPISPEVLDFLRICFSCPVFEGYGQTECVSGGTMTPPSETKSGHVGPPVPSNEVKLVDVPEMDYLSSDKPYPRGEICFRGVNITPGYFKNEEKTKEAIDENGWLHSGDIGHIDEQGNIKVIDRKKNIFKLAQGEYIAPEKIENIYVRSPYILQNFVHGDSLQAVLVGIVVPDKDTIMPLAKAQNIEGEFEDICKNSEINKIILDSMNLIAKETNLRGFECVKKIHLLSDPFSVDNDLLTPTFKLKRPQVISKFRIEIDDLYESLK